MLKYCLSIASGWLIWNDVIMYKVKRELSALSFQPLKHERRLALSLKTSTGCFLYAMSPIRGLRGFPRHYSSKPITYFNVFGGFSVFNLKNKQ